MAKSLNASCNVLLELLQKNGRTSEEGCGECLVGRVAGTLSDGFGIAALFFAGFDGVTVSGFGLYLLVMIGVFFKRGSDVFLLSRFLVLSYVLLILFSFVVRVGFLPLSWCFFFLLNRRYFHPAA